MLQSKVRCQTFETKMSFICNSIKTHFHYEMLCALSLKQRQKATLKYPIEISSIENVHSWSLESGNQCFGDQYKYVVVLNNFPVK